MSTMETGQPDVAAWPAKQILIGGIVAGFIGGLVMMMGEMIVAMMMGMSPWMPPSMMAAMLLGRDVIGPQPNLMVIMTGGMWHMVISMMYGIIFAAAVAYVPLLRNSRVSTVITGAVFGLLLWIVNFYVIAPLAGWLWFPNDTDPMAQSLLHAFTFGLPLGVVLSTRLPGPGASWAKLGQAA